MPLNNTQDYHNRLEHIFESPKFDFNTSTEQHIADTLCFVLSLAQNYWHKGIKLFDQLLDLQDTSTRDGEIFPPIMGGLLLHYYQYAHTPTEGYALLKRANYRVSAYHKQLYTQYDKEEIGLIDSSKKRDKQPLIDVFFHSLLIWSNQAFIKIATILNKEEADIILWNELSIFSCQEQLWNPDLSRFQSIKGAKKGIRSKRKIADFLPLFGNIPTQEEAEEMLKLMQKTGFPLDETGAAPEVPKNFRLPFSTGYLLYQGLLNYDMNEAAECLKEYLLNKKGQKTLAKMVTLSLLTD